MITIMVIKKLWRMRRRKVPHLERDKEREGRHRGEIEMKKNENRKER